MYPNKPHIKHDSQNTLTGKTQGDMGRKSSAVKEERRGRGCCLRPPPVTWQSHQTLSLCQEPCDSLYWSFQCHVPFTINIPLYECVVPGSPPTPPTWREDTFASLTARVFVHWEWWSSCTAWLRVLVEDLRGSVRQDRGHGLLEGMLPAGVRWMILQCTVYSTDDSCHNTQPCYRNHFSLLQHTSPSNSISLSLSLYDC